MSINVSEKIAYIFTVLPLVKTIITALCAQGARVLLVGGGVRDLFLNESTKDLDFEIYNLSPQEVEDILKKHGVVSVIGKSFGVLRVHGLDVDWSLPRTDSAGRKPLVSINPTMSFKEAFGRRDITINAMGIDMQTGELIDPYGGQEDIRNKIIRAVDATTFIEDPLRFYRVMQFVGRFGMTVHPSLNAICKTMDLSTLARERIEAEFEKLLLKSKRPSLGFRWLKELGRLQELMPELFNLIGVPQRPDYHPEGDVFEHSMQVVDAAAHIAQQYDDNEQKLILMYAALFHDIGKKEATKWLKGQWRSHGHAEIGAQLVRPALARITGKKNIVKIVSSLIYYHMDPGAYVRGNTKQSTYKMLAYKLGDDTTIRMLSNLFLADLQGRNSASSEPLTELPTNYTHFVQAAQQAGVFDAPEEPVLVGADLLDIISPGPAMGRALARAYEAQVRKGIRDKAELKKLAV